MRFWHIRICVKLCLNTDILVLILARGVYFGMRLYLYPFSARVGSEGSGETVCM